MLTFLISLTGCSPLATVDSKPKYTVEWVVVGDNVINLIVAPHGNMNDIYTDPHFVTARPQEFIVTLERVSPGTIKLNERIRLPKNNFAASISWKLTGTSLKMTLFLKPKIMTFSPLVGGGFMAGFEFQ